MTGEAARTVIHKAINVVPAEPLTPLLFRNYYECPNDGTRWGDEWMCACNDRCPVCDAEVEPYFSEDFEPQISR